MVEECWGASERRLARFAVSMIAAWSALAVPSKATAAHLYASSGGVVYEFALNGNSSQYASGYNARGLSVDASGNVFVADWGTSQFGGYIDEYQKAHIVSRTVATGLEEPNGITLDQNGNIYEGDAGSLGRILKYTPTGGESQFASNLHDPTGLTFNANGVLFESDFSSGNVYEFTPSGVRSTFASGLAPWGLAFDAAGNLFVASYGGGGAGTGNIYEFTPGGVRSTFASGLTPYGLVFDLNGDLFEADDLSGNIYEFAPGGSRSTFATGLGELTFLAFGPVPEPSTWLLATLGTAGLWFVRRRRKAAQGVSLIFVVSLLVGPSNATAAPLRFGDIVVAAESSGNLYVVNPVTGVPTLISSAGLLNNPDHVILDNQGQILTVERSGRPTPGVVRTDPATGNQAMVASGPLLTYPVALAFDQSNNLVVGDLGSSLNLRRLVSVNAKTGASSLITSLTGISSIQDVDVDQQGRIVVLDSGYPSGSGKIVRYDPTTGQQTTVAVGGNLRITSDLIIRPSGDYLVANQLANGTTQILQIDPTDRHQQIDLTVASEGWIALKDQNDVYYADFYDHLSILSGNLLTGQTTTVSNYQFPENLVGVAVYSRVPEPSSCALAVLGTASLWFVRRRRLAAIAVTQ